MGVLGRYADAGLNFVSGEPLNERNRVEVFIDDQGLYREVQVHTMMFQYFPVVVTLVISFVRWCTISAKCNRMRSLSMQNLSDD